MLENSFANTTLPSKSIQLHRKQQSMENQTETLNFYAVPHKKQADN